MATDFLDLQAKEHPELGQKYVTFKTMYEKKLWHQLTIEINAFLLDKSAWKNKDRNLIKLYDNFINEFKDKLNKINLVKIMTVIAQQYAALNEHQAGITFLESVLDDKLDASCLVVGKMAVAELYLLNDDADKCEEIIISIQNKTLPLIYEKGTQNIANSAFYRVCSAYYKVVGPSEKFYESAIQFLAYTPIEQLDKEKRIVLARDVCFSAFVGANVYNFGEIMPQPILKVLEGTEDAWLLRMLEAFHEGDINAFATLFETHEKRIQQYKILANNIDILRQKVGIMCLLRLVFEKGTDQKVIDLDEIAKKVKIDSSMAEWLLMRAMSKGLLRGKIDGIDRTFTVEWLKPRVMALDELQTLQHKMKSWKGRVNSTSAVLATETEEFYA